MVSMRLGSGYVSPCSCMMWFTYLTCYAVSLIIHAALFGFMFLGLKFIDFKIVVCFVMQWIIFVSGPGFEKHRLSSISVIQACAIWAADLNLHVHAFGNAQGITLCAIIAFVQNFTCNLIWFIVQVMHVERRQDLRNGQKYM